MSDTTPIPGQGTTYSYGRDDYGEYGSALQPETEFQVPEPLDFTHTQRAVSSSNLLAGAN
jgi:hypothetical protein